MIFVGIYPESEARKYPHTFFDHEETHGGKTVKYYECFRNDPDQITGPFTENEEPNPRKIISVWRKLLGG